MKAGYTWPDLERLGARHTRTGRWQTLPTGSPPSIFATTLLSLHTGSPTIRPLNSASGHWPGPMTSWPGWPSMPASSRSRQSPPTGTRTSTNRAVVRGHRPGPPSPMPPESWGTARISHLRGRRPTAGHGVGPSTGEHAAAMGSVIPDFMRVVRSVLLLVASGRVPDHSGADDDFVVFGE